MKTSHNYPPNYDEICKVFKIRGITNVVFTYGDTLYNPGKNTITGDLREHEETHAVQQENFPGGPAAWWKKYLEDVEFRLNQEVKAYQRQYQYCCEKYTRQERRKCLRFFAKSLSGPVYGNSVSESRAEQLIQIQP